MTSSAPKANGVVNHFHFQFVDNGFCAHTQFICILPLSLSVCWQWFLCSYPIHLYFTTFTFSLLTMVFVLIPNSSVFYHFHFQFVDNGFCAHTQFICILPLSLSVCWQWFLCSYPIHLYFTTFTFSLLTMVFVLIPNSSVFYHFHFQFVENGFCAHTQFICILPLSLSVCWQWFLCSYPIHLYFTTFTFSLLTMVFVLIPNSSVFYHFHFQFVDNGFCAHTQFICILPLSLSVCWQWFLCSYPIHLYFTTFTFSLLTMVFVLIPNSSVFYHFHFQFVDNGFCAHTQFICILPLSLSVCWQWFLCSYPIHLYFTTFTFSLLTMVFVLIPNSSVFYHFHFQFVDNGFCAHTQFICILPLSLSVCWQWFLCSYPIHLYFTTFTFSLLTMVFVLIPNSSVFYHFHFQFVDNGFCAHTQFICILPLSLSVCWQWFLCSYPIHLYFTTFTFSLLTMVFVLIPNSSVFYHFHFQFVDNGFCAHTQFICILPLSLSVCWQWFLCSYPIHLYFTTFTFSLLTMVFVLIPNSSVFYHFHFQFVDNGFCAHTQFICILPLSLSVCWQWFLCSYPIHLYFTTFTFSLLTMVFVLIPNSSVFYHFHFQFVDNGFCAHTQFICILPLSLSVCWQWFLCSYPIHLYFTTFTFSLLTMVFVLIPNSSVFYHFHFQFVDNGFCAHTQFICILPLSLSVCWQWFLCSYPIHLYFTTFTFSLLTMVFVLIPNSSVFYHFHFQFVDNGFCAHTQFICILPLSLSVCWQWFLCSYPIHLYFTTFTFSLLTMVFVLIPNSSVFYHFHFQFVDNGFCAHTQFICILPLSLSVCWQWFLCSYPIHLYFTTFTFSLLTMVFVLIPNSSVFYHFHFQFVDNGFCAHTQFICILPLSLSVCWQWFLCSYPIHLYFTTFTFSLLTMVFVLIPNSSVFYHFHFQFVDNGFCAHTQFICILPLSLSVCWQWFLCSYPIHLYFTTFTFSLLTMVFVLIPNSSVFYHFHFQFVDNGFCAHTQFICILPLSLSVCWQWFLCSYPIHEVPVFSIWYPILIYMAPSQLLYL